MSVLMGDPLPTPEIEIAAWFQARLPAEVAHLTVRATKYGGNTPSLDITLLDAEGNDIVFRLQGYDLETKTLSKGDIILYAKSYGGLGTMLLFEVEEYFRLVHGFTASKILATTNATSEGDCDYYNGAYVWATYGYLPDDREIPQIQKSAQESYNLFCRRVKAYGGVIPASFDTTVKSLIEKLATDKTALREIAALRLPVENLFVLDEQEDGSDLARNFARNSTLHGFKKDIGANAILLPTGEIHMGRRLLNFGFGWAGQLDFNNADAMAIREQCVTRARGKLALALKKTDFAPAPPQIKNINTVWYI